MKNKEDLKKELIKIDHKSYGMYKTLGGSYSFGNYILYIDHVQGDPFASPSRLHFEVKRDRHGFPEEYYQEKHRRLALEDQVLRRFLYELRQIDKGFMGSGKSGRITICPANQTVQERIAVVFSKEKMELRFEMGFPARGRTILAKEMQKLVFDILPQLAENTLFYRNWDTKNKKYLEQAIFLADDQKVLRAELKKRNLTAFVADGAVLPRESGVSDRPMRGAVPFASPESMRIEVELPHKGKVTGMGIPEGITVIVGGGYHGKSTLLKALEQGVYNHICGDGREYVVADNSGMKIRAEDGRNVLHTDISMFINHLPAGQDTTDFSSENASGSTSQAAGVIESLEAGAHLFLIDEDTSATNFMLRDEFMQQVISREKEPITPFLERARNLYERAGVSTILVAGSSGAFFYIADHVIQMDNYMPADITAKVRELCRDYPLNENTAAGFKAPQSHRIMSKNTPLNGSKKDYYGHFKVQDKPERLKVKVHGRDGFSIGKQEVDLRYVEQLIDSEQTGALGALLKYAVEKLIDGKRTLPEIVELLCNKLEKEGLSFLSEGYTSCGYAVPRRQEVYACFNRYRRP